MRKLMVFFLIIIFISASLVIYAIFTHLGKNAEPTATDRPAVVEADKSSEPAEKEPIKEIPQDEVENPEKKEEVVDTFTESRSYTTYKNGRLGYSIDFPQEFVKVGATQGGEGFAFESKDKKAVLSVFWKENTKNRRTINHYYNDLNRIKNKSSITYKLLKGNQYILSWHEAGIIHYKSVYAGKVFLNGFTMNYPKATKHYYDPIVYQISQSFTPGKLE